MTKMLDVLEAWINAAGYTYLRLDGATKVRPAQLPEAVGMVGPPRMPCACR